MFSKFCRIVSVCPTCIVCRNWNTNFSMLGPFCR
ncbi:hypothetical protein B8W95_09200 [Staphylococcus pasteuri]|nr:hypothetical protein B8W95_09200 [Staphylococcus pasteuri]